MNPLINHMLAAMMTITAPGLSNYSQVPIERCDAECQVTPRCDNEHDFKCKPPAFNKSLYIQRQEELVASGVSEEEAITQAIELSYTRPETYEEGLARYYVIATQHVEAARNNSYEYCVAENQCLEQPHDHTGEGSLQACYLACSKNKNWNKSTEYLAWALFSVSTFESGWRSDIHSGTGWAGRGDCEWQKTETMEDGSTVLRKVPAWTEGGRPVLSTCKSYGLTQVMFGNPPKTMNSYTEAYTYDRVLGLDARSTYASLDLAARYLIMGERLCRGVKHDWAWAMFSAYGSGAGCDIEHLKGRAGRFWKWAYKSNQQDLAANHLEVLESPAVQELIRHLESAESPVLWMPAEKSRPHAEEDMLVAQNP